MSIYGSYLHCNYHVMSIVLLLNKLYWRQIRSAPSPSINSVQYNKDNQITMLTILSMIASVVRTKHEELKNDEVYSPVHRRRFAHDVDGFGMKAVDDTAAPFNQSFGSQHISPPPTESPNEGDSGLYSPSKRGIKSALLTTCRWEKKRVRFSTDIENTRFFHSTKEDIKKNTCQRPPHRKRVPVQRRG